MHFQSTAFLFLSALGVASAQQNAACSQLAGYAPAVNYCAQRYPAPIPTITKIETKTATVTATTTTTTSIKPSTTSTSVKPSTTSASGNGRTRTITAIAEKTVTNCAGFTVPACPAPTAKVNVPGFSNPFSNPFGNAGGLVRPVSPVGRPSWGRVKPREAEPEADPQFGGFGNPFANVFQAAAWGRLLSSGNSNIQNACSCLRPAASKTVTISATATTATTITATVTATVK